MSLGARPAPANAPQAAPAPPPPPPPQLPPANTTAPAPPVIPEVRIYGVGELVKAARLTLESRFADVRVEGEISGLKRSGPGHLYFALKDEEASLDCVISRARRRG